MDLNMMEDSMEFEYTNAQPYFTPGIYPNPVQQYVPPPPGTFQVPASFFQTMHTKTTAVTNAICDKLLSFSLDDDLKEEQKTRLEEKPSTPELMVSEIEPQVYI